MPGLSCIIAFAVTDFPEPDSPTIPSTSPCFTDNEIFSTAVILPSSVSNLTSRLFIFNNSSIFYLFVILWGSAASLNPSPTKQKDNINTTKNFTGLPVTINDGDLLGIVTMRDLRYEKNLHFKVKKLMTPKDKLITVQAGIGSNEARELLNKYKIEKLPVVNKSFKLQGLITMKDIEKSKEFPNSSKDKQGRLIAAAAIGVGQDMIDAAQALN